MSAPISAGSTVGLQSSPTTNPIVDTVKSEGVAVGSEAILSTFRDILADETMLSKVMDELKGVLPAEEFAKLEDAIESGNTLPLAAIVSPESPLFALLCNGEISDIPQIVRQAIQQDGGQLSPFSASVLKMGEGLAKQGADATKRQVGDAVTTLAAKGEAEGKLLQDLLGAAKTQLSITEVVSRTVGTLAVGGETSVTPSASINSAISGLAQLSNFQVSGGSAAPPAIAAPLGEEGWGKAMGERIMWMIGKGVQTSSIRINPPNLGPIQVHVSVHNDQASVNILAHHGAVKEALEAAIPRLREMMQESNLQLVNVDVSHRENMGQERNSAMFQRDHAEHSNYFMQQEQALAPPVEEEAVRHYVSSGLLDDYA